MHESPPLGSASLSDAQLRLVLEVARSLAVTVDLDCLLTRIAEAVPPLLACERASVFLHDAQAQQLWTPVALLSDPIRVPATSGIVGQSFTSNQVIHCPDAYADPQFNPAPDRRSGFITRNLLAAPMADWGGQPLGVLQAVNKNEDAFTDNDANLLRLLADHAGVAIQRWNLQRQAIRTGNLQHELHLARQVQDALIPQHPPTIEKLSCAGWTRPANQNGGDIYDLWKCGHRLGILVADASGHGMAPALVVSQVRALVRTLSETEDDPGKILWRINDRLLADLESGRFVTAFLGFITPSGSLAWASCGHGPIVLLEPTGPRLLQATWPPLGLMEEDCGAVPEPIQLDVGAGLVILSDGITEAFDPLGEIFGIEGVLAALGASGPDPESAVSAIRAAVVHWQGKDDPRDDQTVVVVRRQA